MKFVHTSQNPVIYSKASNSSSEVKLALRSWSLLLDYFDIRNVGNMNQNHLRALLNVASDDLKTASEVKSQESMYF